MSRPEAQEMIDRIRSKYGIEENSDTVRLARIKEEILARPKLAMTHELIKREKSLKDIRATALAGHLRTESI
jgi:hypothetical protein